MALDSSISILNRGIELYENKNYLEAEVVFGKLLENDADDFMSSIYLSFTKHKQNGDFSFLLKNIQDILKSPKNTAQLDTIYQETISYIASWLEPEIIKNEENGIEIDWDSLIDGLNFTEAEESQKLLSDLEEFYRFILGFPSPNPKQFLKVLNKRYRFPWANSWWAREKVLSELMMLKKLEPQLKKHIEETRILFASISDLHLEVIKLFLETRNLNNYSFENEQIINWNNTINNLFNTIDFTEYELGFSHEERIEPFANEMKKCLSQIV